MDNYFNNEFDELDMCMERSDRQYTDIENFKDYEYTECIAFEMAVRAAKNLILEIIDINMQFHEEYILNEHLPNIDLITRLNQLKEELLTKYYLDSHYFLNDYQDYKYKEVWTSRDYFNSLNYSFYYTFLRKNISDDIGRPSAAVDETEFLGAANFGRTAHNGGKYYVFTIHSQDQINSSRLLKKRKSRPSLIIPKEFNKNISIEVNPNIPIEETIEFLQSALKDIQSKQKSQSIYELIQGMPLTKEDYDLEPLSLENKEFRYKKIVADMFYAYDYITKRLESLKKENDENYNLIALKEELEIAQNRAKAEKASWGNILGETQKYIKELNQQIQDETLYPSVDEILKENNSLLCTNLNAGYSTVQRYYKNIKPFIEEMKYKTLLTGIKQ